MSKSMKKIKLFVMDVDGTLTDGKIYISARGEEFKAFNIKDGYGIANLLPKLGIESAIITGRDSKIVSTRAAELNIRYVYQGVYNKLNILKELCELFNCEFIEVAYIGDDIIDIECMKVCGVSACPSDAVKNVKNIVNFICSKRAGEGAVREFIDWIIDNNY